MRDPYKKTDPLRGLTLSISISESQDAKDNGYTKREVNRSVRDISRAVLAQGGHVAFGHDWREDGVMAEVMRMVVDYQSQQSGSMFGKIPMTNVVPWPRRTSIPEDLRERYRDVLKIIEMPPVEAQDGISKMSEFIAEANALTQARIELTRRSNARLCIGGRVRGSSGFCAGIVEEAALCFTAGLPLYVTRHFGGASSQVIAAIEGKNTIELEAFWASGGVASALVEQGKTDDLFYNRANIFGKFGIREISRKNGLSIEENQQLFNARSMAEVIGLTLTGLGRVARTIRNRDHIINESGAQDRSEHG
nr:hypothetical protein [Aliiroseovarius sp. F20344]